MKKVIALFLILFISIPFFTISASGAEYDFTSVNMYQDWTGLKNYLAPVYVFHQSTNTFELDTYADSGNSFFGYYPKGFKYFSDPGVDPFWTFGDRSYFLGQTLNDYRASYTGTSNVLVCAYNYNRNNSIILPGFEFHGVYLPSAGQYIRISFSLDVFQFGDLPNTSILNFQNLFFLAPIEPTNSNYPVQGTIPCNTVVRSVNGSVANYQVFFDVSNVAFLDFSDEQLSRPFKLVIRIPFYNSLRSVGRVMYINDVAFPSSYDILTVGGYEEVLDNIENAVVKGFDDLDDLLTTQDPDDTLVITELDESVSDLKDTVSDYQEQENIINSIDSSIVLPPLNDTFNDNVLADLQLPDFGNLSILWNDLITEMLIVVLTLGTFAVILYGKRI